MKCSEMSLLFNGLCIGGIVSAGLVAWLAKQSFNWTIISKAESGFRLEVDGRMFSIVERNYDTTKNA